MIQMFKLLDNKSEELLSFLLQGDLNETKIYDRDSEWSVVYEHLNNYHYIHILSVSPYDKHPSFKITQQGINYFTQKEEYLKNKKKDCIKFWIPIILSTCISIVSIIIAICKP